MTIVSAFRGTQKIHSLMADILLSVERPPLKSDDILSPASGKLNPIKLNILATPISLKQKLFIVNDFIALGYSGNSIAARLIFKEFQKDCT